MGVLYIFFKKFGVPPPLDVVQPLHVHTVSGILLILRISKSSIQKCVNSMGKLNTQAATEIDLSKAP